MGRGYQQSLTYLDGANGELRSPARACASRLRLLTRLRDLAHLRSLSRAPADYWSFQTTGFCDPKAYQDLWEHDRPATEMANPLTCSQANQMPNCIYEDDRVANFTLNNVINAHDPATPFHMYIAWHNTHEPLEVPQKQLDKFDFVFSNCTAMGGSPNKNNSCSASFLAATEDGPHGDLADKPCCFRQYYSAMTNYVDMHIGQVVDALKAKGMWWVRRALTLPSGALPSPADRSLSCFCPHPRPRAAGTTRSWWCRATTAGPSTGTAARGVTTFPYVAERRATLRAACVSTPL